MTHKAKLSTFSRVNLFMNLFIHVLCVCVPLSKAERDIELFTPLVPLEAAVW